MQPPLRGGMELPARRSQGRHTNVGGNSSGTTMPREHTIHGRAVLLDDFFRIEEIVVSHRQADGTMSPRQRRLVLERGDAAAVLLLNTDTDRMVLVSQFRPATLGKGLGETAGAGDGWVTEVVAGTIPPHEHPEETAVRETMEETGYRISEQRLEPIATFFSSPGGASERIFLYFAEVRDADRCAPRGGGPDEDIEILDMAPGRLFELMEQEAIEDSKLLIAALWLRERLRRPRA